MPARQRGQLAQTQSTGRDQVVHVAALLEDAEQGKTLHVQGRLTDLVRSASRSGRQSKCLRPTRALRWPGRKRLRGRRVFIERAAHADLLCALSGKEVPLP